MANLESKKRSLSKEIKRKTFIVSPSVCSPSYLLGKQLKRSHDRRGYQNHRGEIKTQVKRGGVRSPMAILRNNIKSFSLVCANISSNTCVDEITYITESSRLVEQICPDTHVYYQQAFCLLNILADGTIFSIVNAAERSARALNRKYREIFPFQCTYIYIYIYIYIYTRNMGEWLFNQ